MKRHLLILAAFVGITCLAVATPLEDLASQTLAAQPNEKVILHSLEGIALLPTDTQSGLGKAPSGISAGGVPSLDNDVTRQTLKVFLGQPVSIESIGRIEMVIRMLLRMQGRPFARVYTPPQDVTDGTIRIVVQLAVLQEDVRVTGNTWFGRDSYIADLSARAGEPLDSNALANDLAWLNRNPFRHVVPEISPGTQPGTTNVTLQTQESFPLSGSFGFDNTGTAATSDYRASASVQWGNAFGRGDLFNAGISGDPDWRYMRSYSAGYTAYLPWRNILTISGAYADIASDLPEPFSQSGTSWQVDARYDVPLKNPRAGWTQDLSFTADFKYSNNTLLFSSIPITGNATDIVQGGVNYAITLPAFGGQNSVSLSAIGSPGGLAGHDHDQDYEGSRPGAKAEYLYGRLTVSHQHLFQDGMSFDVSATAQLSSGALLGTEQLEGTGAAAVRGYREDSAFGDEGVVVNNEFHLPPLKLLKGQVSADLFTFFDAASLNLRVQDQSTDLRSVGLGTNLVCFRHLSVRFAYGWQLKHVDDSPDRGWAHFSANLNW